MSSTVLTAARWAGGKSSKPSGDHVGAGNEIGEKSAPASRRDEPPPPPDEAPGVDGAATGAGGSGEGGPDPGGEVAP